MERYILIGSRIEIDSVIEIVSVGGHNWLP